MDECNQLALIYIQCGSDSLTVNERLMSRGTPASMKLAVVEWYRACETSWDRRTSLRHISSGREQRRERDVSMENVVRDNYVKGLGISCDLNALADGRGN